MATVELRNFFADATQWNKNRRFDRVPEGYREGERGEGIWPFLCGKYQPEIFFENRTAYYPNKFPYLLWHQEEWAPTR